LLFCSLFFRADGCHQKTWEENKKTSREHDARRCQTSHGQQVVVSKALNNNAVSSHEFDIILSEFEQYNILKEQVRAKLLCQPSNRKLVDTEKLEKW